MTRSKIESIALALWKECEVGMGVGSGRTIHNAVIRCAFSQAVFNRYSNAYGQGIFNFIAKVVGRDHSVIGQYVGTHQNIVIKTSYHPATKELTPKFTQRLIKIEKGENVLVELIEGKWYLDGAPLEDSTIEKAIREYASVHY